MNEPEMKTWNDNSSSQDISWNNMFGMIITEGEEFKGELGEKKAYLG